MPKPFNIPVLCASLTDHDLDAIEATFKLRAEQYKYAGYDFRQRVEGIMDCLRLIQSYRKNTRPFCLLPSNFFLN